MNTHHERIQRTYLEIKIPQDLDQCLLQSWDLEAISDPTYETLRIDLGTDIFQQSSNKAFQTDRHCKYVTLGDDAPGTYEASFQNGAEDPPTGHHRSFL